MSAQRHEGAGDCFTAAIDAAADAIEHSNEARSNPAKRGVDRVLVVHGLPTGTGGDVEGVVHWHAWVEVFVDGEWLVADVSNGKRILIGRAAYYRVGKLTNRRVWRYSYADVVRNVARHGNAGPWVPGWQEMGA